MACLCDGAKTLRGVARMPPEFAHVGPSLLIEDYMRRPLGICPLTQVFTIRAEDLDTVTLPITDEDAPISRHGNTVWQIKLPRASTRRAPRALELAARRELVYATITVAIRHVEITPGAHSNIRGAIEGTSPPL